MRILLCAHEFSPAQGSECALGWNVAREMAKLHDVLVLSAPGSQISQPTGSAYADAWSNYCRDKGKPENLDVIFLPYTGLSLLLAKLNGLLFSSKNASIGNRFLYNIALKGWLKSAYHYSVRHDIDLVHQLTPIAFYCYGKWAKTKKPFFWGPVGGMEELPKSFVRACDMKNKIIETARNASISLHLGCSQKLRKTIKAASWIFAISQADRNYIDGVAPGKSSLMIDSAPPSDLPARVRKWTGRKRLHLVWSGRNEYRKMIPYLLSSIAHYSIRDHVQLSVLGSASNNFDWRKLCTTLGLDDIVNWEGPLEYRKALMFMSEADVFVHTSIREAASHVILEALGLGLPVICHASGGMDIAVDDTCGIKVPYISPTESIVGFQNAIYQFVTNRDLLPKLSAGAIARANQLSWAKKVQTISGIYSSTTIGAKRGDIHF